MKEVRLSPDRKMIRLKLNLLAITFSLKSVVNDEGFHVFPLK